jgi:hypothetical protein
MKKTTQKSRDTAKEKGRDEIFFYEGLGGVIKVSADLLKPHKPP